ncbi:hypothetical protein LguiB_011211 [Lonicera macranthoides]
MELASGEPKRRVSKATPPRYQDPAYTFAPDISCVGQPDPLLITITVSKATPPRSQLRRPTRLPQTSVASANQSGNSSYWTIMPNFVVEGSGTIDGNGRIWWQNSCKINKTRAVIFIYCTNLRVENLRIKDAQQMHLRFEKCTNVKASNLSVIAPETSPNTDGIHVTRTKNVKIMTSVIGTGDDCVSIVNGSRNVEIKDITCGPGHGISIGSLGKHKADHHVADIIVDGAKLLGTTNGVRIKSWQGGSGYAKNIKFQNITMQNVFNPLIIDQIYCDSKFPCPEQVSDNDNGFGRAGALDLDAHRGA